MTETLFLFCFATRHDVFFKYNPINIALKNPSVTERVSKELRMLEFQTPQENFVKRQMWSYS